MEPELETHYEPAVRVTPMSPVTEIQALGQLTNAKPAMRGRARMAALLLLLPLLAGLVWQVVSMVRA